MRTDLLIEKSIDSMETIILKLGGSVITEKEKGAFEARKKAISRLAGEIRQAREKREFRLVVVHGAGPFGHRMVADYNINNGLDVDRGIEGFVRTHNSMEDLNYLVMDCFRKEGLLGFPVQPSAVIMQENKKIVSFRTETIRGLLELDSRIVPIMYGDMVLDKGLKGSVVSGDAIIPYLARELRADRILLGTDVDGVFTDDPKRNPKAELVREITNANLEGVFEKSKAATTTDVTGGMRGKLLKIREGIRGTETIVFNANKKGNLYSLLVGKDIPSTRISLK